MTSSRLPRFKRTSTVAPMQLTERDREILRCVHRHRFLRSHQIIALVGASSQQLLRRLKLLFHHGFLERPPAQLEYYQRGGDKHMVYGLGNKGGLCLKEKLGTDFHKLSWGEKNRSVGRIFLEHALLVADVMVTIELACRASGNIRFISQEELSLSGKRQPLQWKVNIGSGVRLGIIPDHVFALDVTDEDGKSDRAFFFLEADRGTMPVTRRNLYQTSFRRKLLAYEATWSQSLHRTLFGFHRFRLLTVTTSAERVKSLVGACSGLGQGHGLFLFADSSILDKPDRMLDSIWQTGKQGKSGSLLD